jgi:H+-transporting ATPase
VLTPLLQAISMLAGDFVTMSRAADRVRPSPYPNAWRIRNLTVAAIPLGLFKLCYYVSVVATGWFVLGLDPGRMRTLTLLTIVFGGQATLYVLSEHRHVWSSCPASLMLLASLADVTVMPCLAIAGLLMTPCRRPSWCILDRALGLAWRWTSSRSWSFPACASTEMSSP